MAEQALAWHAEALREQLEPLLPGLSVELVAQTSSTNTELLERARAAQPRQPTEADGPGDLAMVRRSVESAAFGRRDPGLAPCLLVAETQTGGRGRQGRAWHSAPGASLTFSVSLPLRAADWSGLSLAVGVALADALDPPRGDGDSALAHRGTPGLGHCRIGLKWPNDLWLMDGAGAGRKLGGILIETVASGEQRLAIVGIGLNVKPFAANEAASGFACLQELSPNLTAPQVLRQIARPLLMALQQFERAGFAAFADRFAARDLLFGRQVRTTQAGVPEGVARGVSPSGALMVQTAAGALPVSSGEVSVRVHDQAVASAQPSC
jgi:BirA family biotin operon repressor/biotin-[acetyl-CoA-carboxylase] ligase